MKYTAAIKIKDINVRMKINPLSFTISTIPSVGDRVDIYFQANTESEPPKPHTITHRIFANCLDSQYSQLTLVLMPEREGWRFTIEVSINHESTYDREKWLKENKKVIQVYGNEEDFVFLDLPNNENDFIQKKDGTAYGFTGMVVVPPSNETHITFDRGVTIRDVIDL